jgi:Transposase DDE domain
MLWDEYCLIEVCCIWGGRSFPLAQKVMKHGSATVACQDYLPVLEAALAVLPQDCEVTLLADRGFEHGDLIRWLQAQQWFWCIRAKSDLQIHLRDGRTCSVAQLIPPTEQASLFREVTVLGDISCHLATASPSIAQESWAVLSNLPPSIQTFALYGQRFGGIEPHFKDYKSSAFGIPRSHLRDAEALSRLFLLLAVATLFALSLAVKFLEHQSLARLDWHGQRGLSFLQLGFRVLHRLCYLREPIPFFFSLPVHRPLPACASLQKHNLLSTRIEFSKIKTY